MRWLWQAWLHLLCALHAHDGTVCTVSLRGVPTGKHETIRPRTCSFSIILWWTAVSMRMGCPNTVVHGHGSRQLSFSTAAATLTTSCYSENASNLSVRYSWNSFITDGSYSNWRDTASLLDHKAQHAYLLKSWRYGEFSLSRTRPIWRS